MLSLSCTVKYFFPGASPDRGDDLGSVAADSSVTDELRKPLSSHDDLSEVPLPVVSMITNSEYITFLFDRQVFNTLLKVTWAMIGNHQYSKTILGLTFLLDAFLIRYSPCFFSVSCFLHLQNLRSLYIN